VRRSSSVLDCALKSTWGSAPIQVGFGSDQTLAQYVTSGNRFRLLSWLLYFAKDICEIEKYI